ncbi:MAG: amidohydrolase [Oscillospiraceae bacterium]|nr:amidohydrolase [Oscillospiraceae bacterium]
MDTLFKAVTAVLMDDENTVLKDAYVGVEAGKITYVGTEPPEGAAESVVDGTHKVLMPGIVNAHTHLPMALLRGFADDLDLQTWLFEHIFPAEEKLTGEIVYTGAQLALMECMASGTVSVSDMYFFCDDIARAVAGSGMKANLSRPYMGGEDFDPKDNIRIRDALDLIDKYHGHDNGRILVDAAVHAEYTSIAPVWEAAAALARERGLGMHVHLSETAFEHNECVKKYGLTPAAVLDRHGLFGTRTAAAHCVHLADGDMDILAARGVTAVHNPVSNLKLGSGIARVRDMRDKGLNVALGTDGSASNNSLDMFEEMKTAAILHSGDNPLTAAGALRLATRNGAAAQGRAAEMGRIAVGMDADLVLVDFDKPHLAPLHNAVSSLVYSAHGSDVALTMVRGRVLYQNGEFLTVDRERILYDARRAACIF